MKIAVIYYSFSGTTRECCRFLNDRLSRLGHHVELFELKPKNEERGFLARARAARGKAVPEILDPGFRAGMFDRVIFASPVWASTFTPAMRAFLLGCEGIEGKDCGCFLTCGAQLMSGSALPELMRLLSGRGARVLFGTYVAGRRSRDGAYLDGRFAGLYRLLNPSR